MVGPDASGLALDGTARLGRFALDLRLAAAPGELVGVVGPNGAGKTTLLRLLAGLIGLEAGRLALLGQVLDDPRSGTFVPPESRDTALVFHDAVLFPHLDALANVAFGLRARGSPAPRREALAWLERFGLDGLAARRPADLSAGQRQRVALARALATAPRLLLLDEPFTALDVASRFAARRILAAAQTARPSIRILVSHDPEEALGLASRLVVVEGGRIVQCGTPGELRLRPASRWIADFVGLNRLRGTARTDRVVLAEAEIVTGEPLAAGGEVTVLIHPRAVGLHR